MANGMTAAPICLKLGRLKRLIYEYMSRPLRILIGIVVADGSCAPNQVEVVMPLRQRRAWETLYNDVTVIQSYQRVDVGVGGVLHGSSLPQTSPV